MTPRRASQGTRYYFVLLSPHRVFAHECLLLCSRHILLSYSSSDVLRQAGDEKLNLTSVDSDDSVTAAADQMLPGRDSISRDIDGGTAWFCVLGMFVHLDK